MKILYLKLKNFSTIYTAMNKKEIEIDFTKCKNNIVLLVGSNGSGKTSILSTLHPFAYAGSMDVRNTSKMILDEKDGYKEIHIKDNDNIYKIQHFYKNSKKGIQVKSFIQKNDEELNPNGNVGSFNDIIKSELSLELDFLRLLRLGSNVSNLIDMKTSERKSFTSELLSDINIYTELFKKVNDDNRLLKNLLRSVSEKISKLNIVDRDLVLSEIDSISKSIDEMNNSKSYYQNKIGILQGKISEVLPDGIDDALTRKLRLEAERDQIKKELDKLKHDLSKFCIVLTKGVQNEIRDIEDAIINLEKSDSYNHSMVAFYNNQLSDLYNEDEENDNKIRLFTSDVEYSQITTLHLELTKKIKELDPRFKSYDPVYTKDNLFTILNLTKQIDKIISDIYEFDKRAITKVIELIRSNTNVERYVNNETQRIDKEILKITSKFKNSNALNSPVILFQPPNCCENQCPYLFLYDLLFSDNKDEDKKSLSGLETEKNILNEVLSISKNFDYIFMALKTNMQLLDKGNMNLLSINNILHTVENGRLINGDEYLINFISEVEEYEEYNQMKLKLKEIAAEIKMMNNNKEHIELLKENKKRLFDKITATLKLLNEFKEKENKIQSDIKFLKEEKEKMEKYGELIDITTERSKDLDTVISCIKELDKSISDTSKYYEEIKELNQKISDIEWNLKRFNENLINKKMSIKEFDSLSEERDILNLKFDDLNIIKESLSSTKGIPLLFIQLYLKNTKMYVNNLLDLVYKDEFEIDDFEITSTDFNIPYIKNGIRINDVSYASQGEKSFLSLALSFALITQSIKEYNILLLDEIDATLDTKNRAMFLSILEKQMEVIDAEQVFLITHNNMFDNYPVDIILTTSSHIDNYNNANVIFSN